MSGEQLIRIPLDTPEEVKVFDPLSGKMLDGVAVGWILSKWKGSGIPQAVDSAIRLGEDSWLLITRDVQLKIDA